MCPRLFAPRDDHVVRDVTGESFAKVRVALADRWLPPRAHVAGCDRRSWTVGCLHTRKEHRPSADVGLLIRPFPLGS